MLHTIWRISDLIFKNLEYLPIIEEKDYLDYNSCVEIINEYKRQGKFLSNSFDDDIWYIRKGLVKGHRKKFDFTILNLSKDKIRLIKYWTVNNLKKYNENTSSYYLSFLSKAILKTHFFNNDYFEEFYEWLDTDSMSINQKIYIINSSIDFIEYSKLPILSEYMLTLIEFKSKLIFQTNSRILPSSKYVLQFSYILEDYLKDVNEECISNRKILEKFLLYYPLKIWWELTTIIPMRISEFCILDRYAVSERDDGYFIKVQRIKGLKENQEFKINTKIYKLIKFYIVQTEKYGHSDTLISYRSLIEADKSDIRKGQKKDPSQMNSTVFSSLIRKFYQEVIMKKYNIHIFEENWLKPNDTRHIAFISLMMQGVSPVEVAKIGGHKTLVAQYSYSYHSEYWIDHEVFQLLNNYNSSNVLSHFESTTINNEIIVNAFKKPTSNFRGDLDFGYCSDFLQRCESHVCMSCSHWRLDREEISKLNKDTIKEITNLKSNIIELIPFIYDLNRLILNKNICDYHTLEIKKQETLKSINSKIKNIASYVILSNKGGDTDD